MNNFDAVMEKLSDQKYTKMSDIFKKGEAVRTSKDMVDAKDSIKKASEFEKSGDIDSAKNEYKNALEKLKKCRKFVASIRMKLQNSSMNQIAAVIVGGLLAVLSFFAYNLIALYLLFKGYGLGDAKVSGGIFLTVSSPVTAPLTGLGFTLFHLWKNDENYADFHDRFLEEYKKDPDEALKNIISDIDSSILMVKYKIDNL